MTANEVLSREALVAPPIPGGDNGGRRLALVLEYDGSEYAGFQLQTSRPTVQSEIEAAIAKFTGENVRVRGASRTDSGAHALGQVVDFLTQSKHPAGTFPKALNFHLPQGIKVQGAYEVPQNFHSRKSAVSRTYRYNVLNRPSPSPLHGGQWFWVDVDLNVAGMAAAARSLVGWHDFRVLSPGCPPDKSASRFVSRWDVWREGEAVLFECEASGFLRHQIRRTNGLLLEVGKGRRPVSIVGDVLQGRVPGGLDWPSIPARGLCLMKVTYPDFPPSPLGAEGASALAAGAGPAAETS